MVRPALLLAILLVVLAGAARAQDFEGPDLEIGLAREGIAISSGFSGTDIVLFGSVEGGDPAVLKERGYDLVVVLEGPPQRLTVRRKERRLGVWVNGSSVAFREVPSSYSYASTRPLAQVAQPPARAALRLGLDQVDPRPLGEGGPQAEAFAATLGRLKQLSGLYFARPGGVEFLTPTLFRARLAVPANVPIGQHRARAYLFHEGDFLITRSVLLSVRKTGFEQFIYDLAHRNSFLYGILAVLLAMATGWLASVVFRRD